MMPALARRFFPSADYIVGVSAGVADDLREQIGLPSERVRVVFNPIITPDIAVEAAEPVGHPWFSDGGPVLVAAGRLRPQKDFPTLLRAVALVRDRRPVRLVLLGEGPDRAELEALVDRLGLGGIVDLPGNTDNPYAYFAKCTAYVLSSRWEGLPTVLIEALACGSPIVSTDCPSGPREILDGGSYGVLVPVGDVEALAAAIERALAGDVGRAPAESWMPYTADAATDAYLELLGLPG
jgi:glycosyltransferase involved in cell wall biosynthesis